LTDHDSNFCKNSGKKSCAAVAGRRRDTNGVFAAYQRKIAQRSAQAASVPVAKFMNERAALGKRKYLSRRSL
jgi:hypothetical protein